MIGIVALPTTVKVCPECGYKLPEQFDDGRFGWNHICRPAWSHECPADLGRIVETPYGLYCRNCGAIDPRTPPITEAFRS